MTPQRLMLGLAIVLGAAFGLYLAVTLRPPLPTGGPLFALLA